MTRALTDAGHTTVHTVPDPTPEELSPLPQDVDDITGGDQIGIYPNVVVVGRDSLIELLKHAEREGEEFLAGKIRAMIPKLSLADEITEICRTYKVADHPMAEVLDAVQTYEDAAKASG